MTRFRKSAGNPALRAHVASAQEDVEVIAPATGGGGPLPRLFRARVDLIDPNPDQPRTTFDGRELATLAASLSENGLKQPIGVRQEVNGRFTLSWGERRLRAAKLLGWEDIPALLSTGDLAVDAIIENIHRSDLDPFELSDALEALKSRKSWTQDALAKSVGLSRTWVTRLLGLRRLPDRIREEQGAVRAPARVLAEIAGAEEADRIPLWESYVAGRGAAGDEPASGDGAASDGGPARPSAKRGASDEVAASALPLRAARAVHRARAVLAGLVGGPVGLADVDREALLSIRASVDRLLDAEG